VREKLHARKRRSAIASELGPMQDAGWMVGEILLEGLRLPLTPELEKWPGEEPRPLLWLSFFITKRKASVTVSTTMYNQVDLKGYVAARSDVLEAIAGHPLDSLNSGWPVVWSSDTGWADDVDWSEQALTLKAMTPRWVAVFGDLADSCLRAREELQQSAERGKADQFVVPTQLWLAPPGTDEGRGAVTSE
jgi:hypothetical protein